MGLGGDGRTRVTTPIYETSAFRVLAAHAQDEHDACVIVEAVSRSEASDRALDALFAAHRDPPHPCIARAEARVQDERASYVVIDFPGTADLDAVIRYAVSASVRATHPEADGFVIELREALLASARAPARPTSHRHLGALSMSNVLFAPDGRFALLGFGHNVACHDTDGRLVARAPTFRAPEVALGEAPTVQSDFVALLLMVRGMLDLVDLHDTVTRTLRTNSLLEDLEIVKHILFIESHVLHAHPSERATIEKAIDVSARIRALTGTTPDAPGFITRIGDLLEARVESTQTRRRNLLRVCPAGTWFDRGRGPRVDLSRFGSLGKLLVLLATERIVRPGYALSARTLADATMHGERVLADPTEAEVERAMTSLMRLGLAADLEHTPEGYRLSESVECVLVST